jgi:hypothetical protein
MDARTLANRRREEVTILDRGRRECRWQPVGGSKQQLRARLKSAKVPIFVNVSSYVQVTE